MRLSTIVGMALMAWMAIPCDAAPLPRAGESVAVSASAPSPPPTAPLAITRMTEFAIPFNLQHLGATGQRISEVRLYVSTDQGANWQFYDRRTPKDRSFTFRSAGDGEYWFASRLVDTNGKIISTGSAAEQRVLIDTKPPQLEVSAALDGSGQILVQWQANDPQLDVTSSRVETRGGGADSWTVAPGSVQTTSTTATSMSAEMRFAPPGNSASVSVRVMVFDKAKNSAAAERVVFLPTNTAPRLTTPPRQPPVVGMAEDPFARRNALRNDADASGAPAPDAATPALSTEISPARPAPNETSSMAPVGPATETRSNPVYVPIPQRRGAQPPAPAPAARQTPSPPASLTASNRQTSPSPWNVVLPPGERPRFTSKARFALEYDVESLGPEGAAKVELWGTADGGQSWVSWGEDSDLQSPVEVHAPADGVFGFRVVVSGKTGLAGEAPRRGDLADVWVGVDTTRPEAQLVGAMFGRGDKSGHVLIRWEADDWQLAPRPIRLSYSSNPDGPWTMIAGGLPDTGEYDWQIEARTPSLIYLRLEARDEAGNVKVYDASEPINLEGLRPKARIRDIRPL